MVVKTSISENLSGIFLQPRFCVVTATQSTASKCSFSHALTDTELCLPNHWPSRVAMTWESRRWQAKKRIPKDDVSAGSGKSQDHMGGS